jgi:hypothetical protein
LGGLGGNKSVFEEDALDGKSAFSYVFQYSGMRIRKSPGLNVGKLEDFASGIFNDFPFFLRYVLEADLHGID